MGEDFAASFLTKKGLKIIERNFHTRQGEIDIIALDENKLVFVEVKTRKTSFDVPEESVNEKKQQRIRKIAEAYMVKKEQIEKPTRFDVIILNFDSKAARWHAKWIRNAF